MKISELVKRTGVPKETIHFYIREGLLRKPRKSGVNSAEYNERYVDQIQLIKDLRDNYYLPIPEIKKVVKEFNKQSPSDQAVSQFYSRFFPPGRSPGCQGGSRPRCIPSIHRTGSQMAGQSGGMGCHHA